MKGVQCARGLELHTQVVAEDTLGSWEAVLEEFLVVLGGIYLPYDEGET